MTAGVGIRSLAVSFPPAGQPFRASRFNRHRLNVGRPLDDEPVSDLDALELVSVGRTIPHCELRIAGDDDAALPAEHVGHIHIRGGNVTRGLPGTACYRCLFEEPALAASCATAGVLGPVVGAIGGVAAAVALGLARGERASDATGLVYAFEDLRSSTEPRIVAFAPRPGCAACARAALPPGGERVLVAGGS